MEEEEAPTSQRPSLTKIPSEAKTNASKPGSIANLAGSKANLTGSKANLVDSSGSKAGSQANLTGSQANLVQNTGSKANLSSQTNLVGSKANLVGSQTNLTGSKANLVGSQTNLVGSKANLVNLNGSKANLVRSQTNLTGSKANLVGSQTNLTGSKAELVGSKAGSKANLTGSQTNLVNAEPVIEKVNSIDNLKKYQIPVELPPQVLFDYLKNAPNYTRPEAIVPENAEVAFAKTYLKSQRDEGGDSLYNHLTNIIVRILETRPANALEIFESISTDLKRSNFKVEVPKETSSFRKEITDKTLIEYAKSISKLIKPAENLEADSNGGGEYPDILELAKLWEWAGVSFGLEETYLLFLAVKKLTEDKPLKSVRIWGKIFGTIKNYIIVEAELREGATDDDDFIANPPPPSQEGEGEAEAEANKPPVEEVEGEDGVVKEEEAPLPKPKEKYKPVLTKENRIGVNRYVYYVCNQIGDEWVRLPDVTPENLQESRHIRKAFTGNLKKQINSYPAFNGTEAHLLRCQIARITAATVISPAGYYTNDPDEEEDDASEQSANIIINAEYEGQSNENLSSLENWVHHVQYILPQGRTNWEDPYAAIKASKEEEEEEEKDEEGSNAGEDEPSIPELEPEQGPAILSPINADEEIGENISSWSIRQCAQITPSKFSPITIRSNRWPGACVVAYNDKFTNIYMGDGLKCIPNTAQTITIPKLSEIQKEYGKVEDLVEQVDPTVEEEVAFEDAKKAKEEKEKQDDEEEESGEENEGEEGEAEAAEED